MFIFLDLVPIVFAIGEFIKVMILITLSPVESRPRGKIILARGVLICLHRKDEGFPPKIWEDPSITLNESSKNIQNFLPGTIVFFVKDEGMENAFHCRVKLLKSDLKNHRLAYNIFPFCAFL
jgi:hypothetical protein